MSLNSPLQDALRLIQLAARIDGSKNAALHIALSNRLLRMGEPLKALSRLSSILVLIQRRLRAVGQSCHIENAAICSAVHGSIGACYMELRNFSSAANHFRTAISLRPNDDTTVWQLALAAEYGGDWSGAVAAYRHWLNLQREGRRWPRLARTTNLERRTVAIFCLFRLPDAQGGRWGPSSAEHQGIGGSEEAVILLSRELVKLGWHVEVPPPPNSLWLPPAAPLALSPAAAWFAPAAQHRSSLAAFAPLVPPGPSLVPPGPSFLQNRHDG